MSTANLDPRLEGNELSPKGTLWRNARDSVFSLHGVFYDKDEGLYRRVPKEIAETVSKGVAILSRHTSGGRIRFLTDSPFISLKASLPAFKPLANMPITLSHGFSLFTNGKFEQRFSPKFDEIVDGVDFTSPLESTISFESSYDFFNTGKELKLCEIFFPLYGGVRNLEIGLAGDATIKRAPDYKIKRPLVFYGSSITQGACVSRPGNDYLAILSRMLDADYINLGFSGNGNAENEIINYVGSIDASLFAYDYNLYDNRPKRILPPHLSIYERLRANNPSTPILFHDKPFFEYDTTYKRRRDLIKESYIAAKKMGDELVGLVETEALFGKEERDLCVADQSHPNDLGALRMASAFYPIVKELIDKIVDK